MSAGYIARLASPQLRSGDMSLDNLIPHAQVSVVSGGSQHHQYPILLLLVTLLANTRQTFQIDKHLLQSLPTGIVSCNNLLFIFVAFSYTKIFGSPPSTQHKAQPGIISSRCRVLRKCFKSRRTPTSFVLQRHPPQAASSPCLHRLKRL